MLSAIALLPAATVAAPPLGAITEISAGGHHACALTSAGGIKCWGSNDYGELGVPAGPSRPVPGDVPGLTSGVAAVAAGYNITCALTVAGGVKCWGRNEYGMLGDGTTVSRSTPGDVLGLSSGVAAISVGEVHACALTNGGAVKCWGHNGEGQLGIGSTTNQLSPVDVPGLASGVIAVQAHRVNSCAITSAGGLKCWGNNNWGQLGDGTLNTRTTPTDVTGMAGGVAAVSIGGAHMCALTSSGGVKCWGLNSSGQLGDASSMQSSTPVNATGLANGMVAVSTGFNFSCALGASGGVKCWGANYLGQLGNGTTTQPMSPAPAADVPALTSGVAALSSGEGFSCALLSSGQVRCWGTNDRGQMGDRTSTSPKTTPVSVLEFTFQTIDFAPLVNRDITSSPFAVTAMATSGLPVAFTSTTPAVCTVAGTSVTLVDVGICIINANQAGDIDFYDAPQVVRSFLVTDAAAPNPARLGNLSTRGKVLAGANDPLIGGFIIDGSTSKTVLVRARGPSLTASGVPDVLSNPKVDLYRSSPASFITSNDDWQQGDQAGIIQSLGMQPSDPLESAILVTLGPGAYTAVVTGVAGGVGVAIVEVFEIDRPGTPLTNISTRGQVMTGDDVMIGGFVIQGTGPQTVVIRARGPSLTPFGIPNALQDPVLQVVRSSDQATLAINDDWGSGTNAAQIGIAGFAPSDSRESAVLLTLDPGAYTAIVTGVNGRTGIGIVEVFRQ